MNPLLIFLPGKRYHKIYFMLLNDYKLCTDKMEVYCEGESPKGPCDKLRVWIIKTCLITV